MAKKGEIVKQHLCRDCNESDPSKFFGKMKSQCGKCHAKDIAKRLRNARATAIAYKGGKCERCGYNKCQAALEFHHIDPAEKDPTNLRAFKKERLFAEVDKCVLLCANCHREEHERLKMEVWQSPV
jgi:hypothetical protein